MGRNVDGHRRAKRGLLWGLLLYALPLWMPQVLLPQPRLFLKLLVGLLLHLVGGEDPSCRSWSSEDCSCRCPW